MGDSAYYAHSGTLADEGSCLLSAEAEKGGVVICKLALKLLHRNDMVCLLTFSELKTSDIAKSPGAQGTKILLLQAEEGTWSICEKPQVITRPPQSNFSLHLVEYSIG